MTSTMTPPTASHVAQPGALSPPARTFASDLVGALVAQIIENRVWARTRLLVDLVMLTLASSAAVFAGPDLHTGTNRLLAALFSVVVVLILHARRNGDDRLQASILDTATGVIGAVSSAAILTMAAATALGAAHPIGLTLRLWLFTVVYVGLARAVLVSVRAQAVGNRAFAVPTLIVGAGAVGELIVKRISEDQSYGLRAVGFLDADPMPRRKTADVDADTNVPLPVLGGPGALATAVAQTGARRVILAFSSEPDHALVDTIRECQSLGVEVSLVPRLFESINGRAVLDHVGGLPLALAAPDQSRASWQFVVKHGSTGALPCSRLIAAGSADGCDRPRGPSQLSGPSAVSPAARRSRRPGIRRPQVPHDVRSVRPGPPSICPRDARPAASRVRTGGPDSAAGCATTRSTSYRS